MTLKVTLKKENELNHSFLSILNWTKEEKDTVGNL